MEMIFVIGTRIKYSYDRVKRMQHKTENNEKKKIMIFIYEKSAE